MKKRDLSQLGAFLAEINEREAPDNLDDAIREQALTRKYLDAYAEVKAALENRHSWLQTAVVPQLMGDATSHTLKGVGRVNLRDDVYVSTPSDHKEEIFTWFGDNGFGDMITRTINGSTLAAFIRRRIKAGEEMPPHVKVTPYTKAVITSTSK